MRARLLAPGKRKSPNASRGEGFGFGDVTGAHLHHVGSRGEQAGQSLSSRAAWPGWGHGVMEAGRNGRECANRFRAFWTPGVASLGRPA